MTVLINLYQLSQKHFSIKLKSRKLQYVQTFRKTISMVNSFYQINFTRYEKLFMIQNCLMHNEWKIVCFIKVYNCYSFYIYSEENIFFNCINYWKINNSDGYKHASDAYKHTLIFLYHFYLYAIEND